VAGSMRSCTCHWYGIDFKAGFFGLAGPVQIRATASVSGFPARHAYCPDRRFAEHRLSAFPPPRGCCQTARPGRCEGHSATFVFFDTIGFRRHQTDRRIVLAFVFVVIGSQFCFGHGHPWTVVVNRLYKSVSLLCGHRSALTLRDMRDFQQTRSVV